MTSFKRPLGTLGAGVLLALSLTACGGGYPTNASDKDFCKGLADATEVGVDVESGDPSEEDWEKFQDAYADLGEIGTPEDIGDDEREGFEVFLDAIADLDYDEAKDEFGEKGGEDVIPGASDEESKNAIKFFTYAQEKCAAEVGG